MSAVWIIEDGTYNILESWYGKTIIHSTHELSYQVAQQIVDDTLSTDVCSSPHSHTLTMS